MPHSPRTTHAQPAPPLSVADALATLLDAARPVGDTDTIATLDALNRVLAADVVSTLDVPPTPVSAMDGYAVRVADLVDPAGCTALAGSTGLPGLQGSSSSSPSRDLPGSPDSLADSQDLPESPDLPGSQDLSGLLNSPDLRDLPKSPDSLADSQNLPETPDLPGSQGLAGSLNLPDLRDLAGSSSSPNLQDLPRPPDLPGSQNLSGSSNSSDFQDLLGLPDSLGLQDLSGLSNSLDLQGLPELPNSLGLQDLPKPPDSPDLQDLPRLPDSPGLQDLSGPLNSPSSQDLSGLPDSPNPQNSRDSAIYPSAPNTQNSAKSKDHRQSRWLPVSQRIAAGHAPQPLAAGTAARIFTGAPIPPGADAVVMQEQTESRARDVLIAHAPKAGEWITAQGANIRRGAVVLCAGTRLTPQALGLAASVGRASLVVARRLKVAVFFTGDELTMPGEPLRAGAIYNSNRFTLRALLANLGCHVTDYGIVPDQLDATRTVLREAARTHDLILTSGGVSVGDEDYVRRALEAEGRLSMWRIAMKPGKPLAFGAVRRANADTDTGMDTGRAGKANAEGAQCTGAGVGADIRTSARAGISTSIGHDETFFFGLPGNPVSSFVTFLLFVRPFVLRLMGMSAAQAMPLALSLRADFTQTKSDARNEFLRARVNAAGGLDLYANQQSAILASTIESDGLIDNPPNRLIRAGDTVRFLPFSSLIG